MKTKTLSLTVLLASQIFLLTNCSPSGESKQSNPDVQVFTGATALTIQDTSGNPIPAAQVLIGDSAGVPFTNNLLTADAKGNLTLPSAWTSPATVSISAAGFVTASFLHSTPATHTFKLRKQLGLATVEYSGQTTGYPAFDDFSVAHVSLVFEALKRSDLANFSISKIVSPESDSFSVLGNAVTVPSNLAIPNQTLSYIIHINVNKPEFRIPLTTSSDHLMIGLHAQFPVTDLVKAVRSKASIFDMINFFNFTSVSQQNQHVDTINVNRDVDISKTPINLKNHVQAQKFGANLVLLAISSFQQSDALIPLDVKNVASGTSVDLNTLSLTHTSEKTISVLRSSISDVTESGASQELMSVAIHDASQTTLPDQLGILAAPTYNGTNLEQVLPTAQPTNIKMQGMYYSYNGVASQTISGVVVETKSPLWDVYNPNWESNATFPTLPSQMTTATLASSHRWTVSLLGQDTTTNSDLGPDRLANVNYLTRAAVDFK